MFNTIDLVNDPVSGNTDLTTLIRKIPSINVTGSISNPKLETTFGQPIPVYLDGVSMDFDAASLYPVSDLALISYVYGSLQIYTRKGTDMGSTPGRYLFSLSFPGYSVTKQFYAPEYKTNFNAETPDTRSTLYWNPDIFLDKNKQSERLSFYNADNCPQMRVVIEGYNRAGQFCRIEQLLGK